MNNYAPMLAIPLEKAVINDYTDWAVEEKYDGHRLVVHVACCGVTAWTRPRKHAGSDGKTMAQRTLPKHLVDAFLALPHGVYDGELLGGDTSTDVTRNDLQHVLRFVVFDLLALNEGDLRTLPWSDRRALLERSYQDYARRLITRAKPHIALAEAHAVTCKEDVVAIAQRIWERGGEGVMLKHRAAKYESGKRSKHLVKVKKLQTTTVTVIGFEPTSGKVMNRGIFASVVVRDRDGNETSVKTKDDAELDAFRREWAKHCQGKRLTFSNAREELRAACREHPALGRTLRIEFQDWTPRGGYRHPRWDRWENE